MTDTWKPRSVEETQAWLEEKKASGKKIEGAEAADLLATALSNISELIVHALFDHPDARNYLAYSFVGDKSPEYDLEVVLLKWGAAYPANKEIETIRANLVKAEKIIDIVHGMHRGQQLDLELFEALKDYSETKYKEVLRIND